MTSNEALSVLFECANKLETKSETWFSAAIYYHTFFKECCCSAVFDKYLVAATCLYLSSKAEEDHLKLRDIINIFYETIHKKTLQTLDDYFNLRESIVNCELFVSRVLHFKFNCEQPIKYLNSYWRSVKHWLSKEKIDFASLTTTSKSFLRDFCRHPNCITYKGKHIALSIIDMCLDVSNLKTSVPSEWKHELCEDFSRETVTAIIADITWVNENKLSTNNSFKGKSQ
ncbi:cyclin-related protein FAM58A-like protein [Leptotrombidium deliense]|uniref:Cyclin-related protein FAM58A-like protein n=1 Tax=Leptotrombidium deliense TaxID=299467 RepID=A0A443SAV7_9ACAR|nr:cyclin-related protein FAM58A-like protein [Leptotrombidium deliense]